MRKDKQTSHLHIYKKGLTVININITLSPSKYRCKGISWNQANWDRDIPKYLRYKVLMAAKMSVLVFWVVKPCGLAGRYHRFGGTYCLHLQGWRRCLPTSPHGVTTHKTNIDTTILIWMSLKIGSVGHQFRITENQYVMVVKLHSLSAMVLPGRWVGAEGVLNTLLYSPLLPSWRKSIVAIG
jgi:hypothetical protein